MKISGRALWAASADMEAEGPFQRQQPALQKLLGACPVVQGAVYQICCCAGELSAPLPWTQVRPLLRAVRAAARGDPVPGRLSAVAPTGYGALLFPGGRGDRRRKGRASSGWTVVCGRGSTWPKPGPDTHLLLLAQVFKPKLRTGQEVRGRGPRHGEPPKIHHRRGADRAALARQHPGCPALPLPIHRGRHGRVPERPPGQQ